MAKNIEEMIEEDRKNGIWDSELHYQVKNKKQFSIREDGYNTFEKIPKNILAQITNDIPEKVSESVKFLGYSRLFVHFDENSGEWKIDVDL